MVRAGTPRPANGVDVTTGLLGRTSIPGRQRGGLHGGALPQRRYCWPVFRTRRLWVAPFQVCWPPTAPRTTTASTAGTSSCAGRAGGRRGTCTQLLRTPTRRIEVDTAQPPRPVSGVGRRRLIENQLTTGWWRGHGRWNRSRQPRPGPPRHGAAWHQGPRPGVPANHLRPGLHRTGQPGPARAAQPRAQALAGPAGVRATTRGAGPLFAPRVEPLWRVHAKRSSPCLALESEPIDPRL